MVTITTTKNIGKQEKNTFFFLIKVMDDPKQGPSEVKIKWPRENCPFSCVELVKTGQPRDNVTGQDSVIGWYSAV